MKKVGLYVRVSTQEQKLHGISIDSQLDALQKYCEEKGYFIAATYNDAGISAHVNYTKRPGLLQMIQDCQEKKIELLLFTRLDRFFRSVKDYYLVTSQMAKVPWKAIWEDYETETSSGQFKVNIMLSIAEAEAARTSERIKSAMDYKKQRGEHVGSIPLGYKLVDKKLAINPDTEPIVKKIFELYESGKRSSLIRKYLASVGYKTTGTNVYKILYNPVYAGDDSGSPCPAYISKELHQRILASRGARDTRSDRRTTYVFSGLLNCGICGARMHPHKGHNYKYYSCSTSTQRFIHPGLSVSEKKMESALFAQLPDLADTYNLNAAANASQESERKKEIIALNARLKRIGDRYEDGDISKEEYRSKRDEIKTKIATLEAVPSAKKITLPSGFAEIYAQLDDDGKQQFWRSLISRITVDPDRKYNFQVGDIFWS